MASNDADGRAVDPEHSGDKLVGQWQLITAGAIVHCQNHSTTTGFYSVNSTADPDLQDLREQKLEITKKYFASGCVGLNLLAHVLYSHP
jgi:hypothetical protein